MKIGSRQRLGARTQGEHHMRSPQFDACALRFGLLGLLKAQHLSLAGGGAHLNDVGGVVFGG